MSAVVGIGPSEGGCASAGATAYGVQEASFDSDHAGSSCRQTMSGSSLTASSTVSRRKACRCGGAVCPWNTFQVRISKAV
jgi:hypothetical protein